MPQQYHTKCLISNLEGLVPLKGYERHELVKSTTSGLVFMHRIPTLQELNDHYDGYPRNSSISELTQKRYNELLDEFETYRKNNKILEIGCGDGHFLVEAQKRGWTVMGTEYTEDAIKAAQEKGINIFQGKLNPNNFDLESFDIVASFEVIEHINNPLEEVHNIYSLLRSGGLFYVTTPNFNALERYYLGADYPIINYPEHLIYFTPKTLNKVLTKTGFKPKKLLTTGLNISSFRAKKKTQLKKNGKLNSTDSIVRQGLEKNKLTIFIKNVLNWCLTITHLGNAMKGYYEK